MWKPAGTPRSRDLPEIRRALRRAAAPYLCLLTGDLNFKPDAPEHERITSAFGAAAPRFMDAWEIAHPNQPHAHTVGQYENGWAEHPYCCDFVFVTEDLASRVRKVTVDAQTQASDHQPLLIELTD